MISSRSQEIPEETFLSWKEHLAMRYPLRAAALCALLLVCLVLGTLFVHSLPVCLIVCFALFSSVSEFILPIHYRLTSKGAYSHCLLTSFFIAWKDVCKVYQGKDGIKLSPLEHRSRMEIFRGVTLRFGNEDREQILAEVQKCRQNSRLQ